MLKHFFKRIIPIALVLLLICGIVGIIDIPTKTGNKLPEQLNNIFTDPWQERLQVPYPSTEGAGKEKEEPQSGSKEREKGSADSPIGPLPWVYNPSFHKAVQEHATPVLMAAYVASLPDPILNERYNISLAANMLAGTVVQPGEVFSQNKYLGPYTEMRGFRDGPTYADNRIITTTGGGVCKIASFLYNLVILSNLEVVERHPHSLTVPYVPPGQDATVAYGFCDFRFRNNTEGPILIWAQFVGEALYMAFYGYRKPPKVTWHHQTLKHVKTWAEYRYIPELSPGSRKTVITGQDGIVVRSWIMIAMPNGEVTRKDLGVDYYAPCPHIIEVGSSI